MVFVLMAWFYSVWKRGSIRLLPILLVAHAGCAADYIQFVAGGTPVSTGADGTVYVLDTVNPAAPTSGVNLLRFDPATGQQIYGIYLNFHPAGWFIDAKGAAYLYGISLDPYISITPGAYDRHITGGEQLVVAKVNPSGTAMEFVTLLGGSAPPNTQRLEPGGVAVGPDGAVYVTGITCSKDFPTTPDAFRPAPLAADGHSGCDGFFAELNSNASQLVYSTYLGGSGFSYGIGVSQGDDGMIRLVGGTSAADFPTTTDVGLPSKAGTYVATWDPGSRQFTALAVFGYGPIPSLCAWNGNRLAVDVYAFGTPIPQQYQTLWPVTPDGNSAILVLETNPWRLVYATGIRKGDAYTQGLLTLSLDRDGSLTLTGWGTNVIPASPGAHSLFGSNFVATIDPPGTHSLATYFEAPSYSTGRHIFRLGPLCRARSTFPLAVRSSGCRLPFR